VEFKVRRDARKEPAGPKDLAALFDKKSRLLVAKGKKLVDAKLADLSKAELEKLVIGPSGKLRAPTLFKGKTVMVGFHEEAYDRLFG